LTGEEAASARPASAAPAFRFRRMVDLSRPMVPGEQTHPWLRFEARVESIVASPADAPPEGRWYVVTRLDLSGHAGTHVEAPLHAVAGGASVGELAVERFFGETVVLDLSDVPWSRPFDLARLQRAAASSGGISPGDIAFMRFDWDRRSAEGDYPPYPTPEALGWLVEQGVKLLGIDSPGLEVRGDRGLVNHHVLFDAGVPLIESLARLDELGQPRVYVFAQPLPAHGTDAIPLRVLAFEL
jgi:arylformamidase